MALKSLFRCQMAELSKTLLHPSGKTNTLGNRGCHWVAWPLARCGSDRRSHHADLPGSAIIYCLRVLDGAGTLGDKRLLVCADQQLISVH